MKNLTVRNLPPDVGEALEREKQRRGTSLNQTVIELLGQGLGVSGDRSNGVAHLGGLWTAKQLEEFEATVAAFGEIDPELWR